MAQMHPAELPIAVLADPARRIEADIFKLLAERLDDGFHVFFRPSVSGQRTDSIKIADFVILHNKFGLLGLAIGDDTLPYAGTELKPLPYSPIRSAVRSLIFGLKEQGIRFYIPAPCAVLFPRSARGQYQPAPDNLEYKPLFAADFDDLQNKIIALMPITEGFETTWRVPDAVEKIMPHLQVTTPLVEKTGAPVVIQSAPQRLHPVPSRDAASLSTSGLPPEQDMRPRIVYVVRAIDIVLAFATIVALIMLISFVPDGVIHRIIDFSHEWSQQHASQDRPR